MNKLAFVFVLFVVSTTCAQQPSTIRQERQPLTRVDPERAAKAHELLTQARVALGQSAKLDDIKTLSVNGKVRRIAFLASRSTSGHASVSMIGGDIDPTILGTGNFKEEFVSGKVEYDFLLPGKFRWQDEMDRHQRIGFFEGNQFWQKSPNNAPVPPPHFAAMIHQRLQAEYAYITLGLLLTPPPGFSVEYSYTDEKAFRQTIAEVIAITGPGTFKADLYLDQKTHLPLLLRLVVGAPGQPIGVMTPAGTSREEALRQLESAKAQASAKPPGQQEREKLILFEDYRVVDGILFPHKITTQINGKLIEELSFTKFKVNQPIKAEKFTEKQ